MFVAHPVSKSFDERYGECWGTDEGVHAVLTNQAHENFGERDFATMDEAIQWCRSQMLQ